MDVKSRLIYQKVNIYLYKYKNIGLKYVTVMKQKV